MGGVISADDPKWIEPFSGLTKAQIARLVALVRLRGGDVQRGCPWYLPLEDQILLVATCWRTNLTLRKAALLFGISKVAADRTLDHGERRPSPGTRPGRIRPSSAAAAGFEDRSDFRLKGTGVHQARLSIARLHNPALTR